MTSSFDVSVSGLSVVSKMAGVWFRAMPPEPVRVEPFRGRPGGKDLPPRNASPVAYFMTLFTGNLMPEMVRQTNRYARAFINANSEILRPNSRVRRWTSSLKLPEFKGFIAMVINMGLIRKATIPEYWNSNMRSQSTKWWRDMMSRNKFQLILKFLHVADNKKLPNRNSSYYRPDSKFKPLLDFINRKFLDHYVPRREISVDERLLKTRGRTSMLQYIPTKAAKFGVKFWTLAESATGYVMNMDCYLGKQHQPTPAGESQGTNVVFNLLQRCNLLNKGYHVVCDSFFTSLKLAKKLLDKLTYITGTLRSNRPMPRTIKTPDLQAGDCINMRQGQILISAYKNATGKQKVVRLVSSIVNADTVNGKPKIITTYNKNMGGVDTADMMTSFYGDNRKSLKVWKKVVTIAFDDMEKKQDPIANAPLPDIDDISMDMEMTPLMIPGDEEAFADLGGRDAPYCDAIIRPVKRSQAPGSRTGRRDSRRSIPERGDYVSMKRLEKERNLLLNQQTAAARPVPKATQKRTAFDRASSSDEMPTINRRKSTRKPTSQKKTTPARPKTWAAKSLTKAQNSPSTQHFDCHSRPQLSIGTASHFSNQGHHPLIHNGAISSLRHVSRTHYTIPSSTSDPSLQSKHPSHDLHAPHATDTLTHRSPNTNLTYTAHRFSRGQMFGGDLLEMDEEYYSSKSQPVPFTSHTQIPLTGEIFTRGTDNTTSQPGTGSSSPSSDGFIAANTYNYMY